jgi:hypothetical protein
MSQPVTAGVRAPAPMPVEALWDANDVARYLKVSRSWVYQRAEALRQKSRSPKVILAFAFRERSDAQGSGRGEPAKPPPQLSAPISVAHSMVLSSRTLKLPTEPRRLKLTLPWPRPVPRTARSKAWATGAGGCLG